MKEEIQIKIDRSKNCFTAGCAKNIQQRGQNEPPDSVRCSYLKRIPLKYKIIKSNSLKSEK